MFELDIDMLKEQGIQLFDTAKKTAQDIADKGKNQLELRRKIRYLMRKVLRVYLWRSTLLHWPKL